MRMEKLDCPSPLQAEAKAVLLAAQTALQMGWKNLTSCTDALLVVQVTWNYGDSVWEIKSTISDILCILKQFDCRTCCWVPRDRS